MGQAAEQWHELFVAAAGAGAALAGLVFVAVSINLDRILALTGAPERALQTVLLLLGVVLVSLFGLVPQGETGLGVQVLAVGVAQLAVFAATVGPIVRSTTGHPSWTLSRLVVPALGSVPYVIAGVMMLTGAGDGLQWVLTGIIAAIVGAVANAWVLLVEILR